MYALKGYQQRSLEALETFFSEVGQSGGVRAAFKRQQPTCDYHPVPGLDGLPYVCLRVPTGGGKTYMACHALGIIARRFLPAERAVCLWLVPSNAIKEQTLKALKERRHPYRQALDTAFGDVEVMSLQEALAIQRATLDGATVVIVSTLASSRVEETDIRKVYESAGALQHHFVGLGSTLEGVLERKDGSVPFSLCNVLRMRRPVVIMDEAHNARTDLSFATLARFNPSCILEFTATPKREHQPEKGEFASNVLHQVTAAELKAEAMIKLPVHLRQRDDWREVVADALQMQRSLEEKAKQEERATGEYLRPIILFQSEARRQGEERQTYENLKRCLLEDFRLPEGQIAVVTGDVREIEGVDLKSRDCPIRYIITQKALAEGWDCSFAYILCSLAGIKSERAVEQILGRVLRLPNATRKGQPELNCAYAFVTSPETENVAQRLKDALVKKDGFEKMEAEEGVVTLPAPTLPHEGGLLFNETRETLTARPDLEQLSTEIQESVTFDPATKELVVTGPMDQAGKSAIQSVCATDEDKEAIERIYHRKLGRTVAHGLAVPASTLFLVPLMAIRRGTALELFEESRFLDIPWNLAECDAGLQGFAVRLPQTRERALETDLDTDSEGRMKIEVHFIDDLRAQIGSLFGEPGWTVASLANWLDQQIPHPDISKPQSSLFIHRALSQILENGEATIEELGRRKFRLRDALAARIEEHRQRQRKAAYQAMLFGPSKADIAVDASCAVNFEKERYAPSWYYEGRYHFSKHLFPVVGELLDKGEEFECARFLDLMPQVKFWVRNLGGKGREAFSFWLQTSSDRFYPDFVAKLQDGRVMVVEYKGADRWSTDDSKEKRAIGDLWAARSGGKCVFVMPNGLNWAQIEQALRV